MIDSQGKELSVLIEIHFRMKIGTRQFFFGTRNGIFLSDTEEIKNPEKFFYWLLTKNKIGKIVNLIFQIRQLSSSIWDIG